MDYIQKTAVLVLLILVGTTFSVSAQDPGTFADFVPESVIGIEWADVSITGYQFYPIGWARDGKLAYALYTNLHEGLGPCTDLSVIVQNMVTDEIVDTYEYFSYSEGGELASVWHDHGTEYIPLLERHEIIPVSLSLERFPYVDGTHEINVEFEIETRENDEFGGAYGDIVSFEAFALSNIYGRKRITRQLWEGNMGGFLAVGALGYLESPYEERIAVIVSGLIRGWEGPPNIRKLFLVGSHLSTGF